MTLDEFLAAGGQCESLDGSAPTMSSFKWELTAPKGKTFANGKTFMLAVSMSGVKERLAGAKLLPAKAYYAKVA